MIESDLKVEIRDQVIIISDKDNKLQLVSSKLLHPKSSMFQAQIKVYGKTQVYISSDEIEKFTNFITIASKKALEIYEVLKPKD